TALSADAVTLAQLSETHCFFLRHSHKLLTQRHETNNSPRHSVLPLSSSGRIMPLVISKVLPMSPVHLLPMSPVYTPLCPRGNFSLRDFEPLFFKRGEGEILDGMTRELCGEVLSQDASAAN